MRRFFFFITFLLETTLLCAQSSQRAEMLYKQGDYVAAGAEYARLVKVYPSHALYNHRYARCAWEQGDLNTALTHFLKSGDRYTLTHFYLGEVYAKMWYADEAIAAYRQYLDKSVDREFGDYAQEQIDRLEILRRYLKRVQRLAIQHTATYGKDAFLQAYTPYSEVGRLFQDSTHSVSFVNALQDRRVYAAKDSISRLVTQYRLLDSWSEPDTLPRTVNFTSAQNYPFLMTDGVTLYFAAQDPEGFGGYDLYVTRYNAATEQFTTPENMGLPFNSEKNDYMFFVDENRHTGLFATDRFTTDDSVCVYTFVYDDNKQYIHTDNTDTLVAYATLRLFDPADEHSVRHDSLPTPLVTTAPEVLQEDMIFVLNDSTVYTHLDHFLNDSAKESYLLSVEREKELHQLTTELDALRQRFMVANEDERQQLAPSILRKENRQGQCIREIDTLLNQARSIEQREY